MFEKRWRLCQVNEREKISTFSAQSTKDKNGKISSEVQYIDINSIRPNPYQPRKQFSTSSLNELCESIKSYGVMHPISVRKITANTYELVAGERRLRAATMAGLSKIPVTLISINDNDQAIIALIENIQRENLGFLDEAEAYDNLLKNSHITQEELAVKIGKSQSTIANKLRLLRLPSEVKRKISENELTERHARALLKVNDEKLQNKILDLVCEKGLNVKKTEDLVDKVYNKYVVGTKQTEIIHQQVTKVVSDVRIFVNTIKQAIEVMKNSGIPARAAQFDRGEYVEFVVRIPKKQNKAS